MYKKMLSTFEKEMKNPDFKKAFEKSYERFLRIEAKLGKQKEIVSLKKMQKK